MICPKTLLARVEVRFPVFEPAFLVEPRPEIGPRPRHGTDESPYFFGVPEFGVGKIDRRPRIPAFAMLVDLARSWPPKRRADPCGEKGFLVRHRPHRRALENRLLKCDRRRIVVSVHVVGNQARSHIGAARGGVRNK